MSNTQQEDGVDEVDEFEESIEFYVAHYTMLTAKEGRNMNPAAACVILLCTAVDCSVSALINALPSVQHDQDDG